jgi:two-component system phosphate regulon sensor histidine kinase PhoR
MKSTPTVQLFKLSAIFILLYLNTLFQVIPPELMVLFGIVAVASILNEERSALKRRYEQDLFQTQATSLKAMRETNVRSEQLETIVQSLTFPLLLLDQSKSLVRFNQAFLDLNRLTKNSAMSDMNFEVLRFIDQSFLKEEARSANLLIENQDYQAFATPVFEAQRFSGMLFIFQNITTVMERERMQKRFIADASHELKTPIAAIKGMIEILNREDFDDEEASHEFKQQIQIETERMETIVQSMLELSRLSSKQNPVDLSTFNLYKLIKDVKLSFKMELSRKQLLFKITADQQLEVVSDFNKLRQILINLVDNAIKYSEQGQIKVEVIDAETHWSLAVCDEGYGIATDQQRAIFDRFYRVDESRSRRTGGSGLGLAIVKQNVDLLQGQIEVESQPDQGSRFILTFKKT